MQDVRNAIYGTTEYCAKVAVVVLFFNSGRSVLVSKGHVGLHMQRFMLMHANKMPKWVGCSSLEQNLTTSKLSTSGTNLV